MAEEKHHKHTGPRMEDAMVVEKVDKIVERISSHKNVEGVIVCDKDGSAIQTTLDNTNTVLYAEGVRNAANIANSMVRDVDPSNELLYIRIGSKRLEMLAKLDPEYLAIVIQSRIRTQKKDVDTSAI